MLDQKVDERTRAEKLLDEWAISLAQRGKRQYDYPSELEIQEARRWLKLFLADMILAGVSRA